VSLFIDPSPPAGAAGLAQPLGGGCITGAYADAAWASNLQLARLHEARH